MLYSRFLRYLFIPCVAIAACTATNGAGTSLTADTVAVGNSCVTPTGVGTTHSGDITQAAVWRAADGPHTLTSNMTIKHGVTLTLEPCAEVRIRPGVSLSAEGTLIAIGEEGRPIAIAADDPAHPFAFLTIRSGGFGDVAWVHVSHGAGETIGGSGVIDVWGPGSNSSAPLELNARVRHVHIDGSEQYGLTLERGGGLTADSEDLTITGAKLGAISTRPRLAGTIPSGQYTGNTVDAVQVIADEAMTTDTIWRDRGVPYRVGEPNGNGADFWIGDSAKNAPRTVWTLDPGVVVSVGSAGRITLRTSAFGQPNAGVLVAKGTAAKPIVFTSSAATPAAGDWRGLVWDGVSDPADRLEYVHVAYAGGPSGANSFHCSPKGGGAYSANEDAAIALFAQPGSAFIQNCTLENSGGDGIDLAYSGSALDFRTSNTFTQIAGCNVTTPRAADGVCTGVIACP